MDGVNHSRLLKFLVSADSANKMAENKIIFENFNPNINSEVPGEQKKREAQENSITAQTPAEDNYVHIMKVTKNEAAFTKGELKLQKVEVTENISNDNKEIEDVEVNPFYSSVSGDVISGPHPLRKDDTLQPAKERKPEQQDNTSDNHKAKTKIPVLKFKQTVEKIKQDRRNSSENIEKEEKQVRKRQKPRRSSIPKLKQTTVKPEIVEAEPHSQENETAEPTKPEDEFDKIFEDIVHSNENIVLDDTILPDTDIDCEKVDLNFEKIIHAYDGSTNNSVVVDNIVNTSNNSKKPLMRHKSQDETRVKRKRNNRRRSLKSSISIDQKEDLITSADLNSKVSDTKSTKMEIHGQQNDSKSKDNQEGNSMILTTKEEKKLVIKPLEKQQCTTNKEKEYEADKNNDILTENGRPLDSKDVTFQQSFIREQHEKEYIAGKKDKIPKEGNTNTTEKSYRNKNSDRLPLQSSQIPVHLKYREQDTDLPSKISRDRKKVNVDNYQYKMIEKVPSTSLIHQIEIQKIGNTEKPKRNKETFKINDNETKDKFNTFGKNSTVSFVPLINSTTENKPDNISKDTLITQELLANPETVENVEISDRNIFDNKLHIINSNNKIQDPLRLEKIDRDLEIKRNKYEKEEDNHEDAFKTITNDKIEFNSNDNSKTRNIPTANSKVSRLISKIDSKKEPKESLRNEEFNGIPRKSSILSKISMFEHQSQSRYMKESKQKPKEVEVTKNWKIKDETSTRKPKIIEEVLKSSPLRRSIELHHQNSQTTHATLPNEEQVILQDKPLKHEKIYCKTNDFKESPKPELDFKPSDITSESINVPQNNEKIHKPLFRTTEFDKKLSKIEPQIVEDYPKNKIVRHHLKRIESSKDTELERQKSIVDEELGDFVKGKVNNIIRTITTESTVETIKKDVFIMEMKKKRSVSEKIALFERKITPVIKAESLIPKPTAKEHTKLFTTKSEKEVGADLLKPSRKSSQFESTENEKTEILDYNARIKELKRAKEKYGSINDMPVLELRNGMKMPILAVGTSLLDSELTKHIIEAALDLGYRAIDTAYIYGNEKLVGEAIQTKLNDGTVTREDLFIMSKLWSTFHRPDLVERACRDSLEALGLEYFDLYMIHNPMSFKEGKEAIPTIANVIQYSEYDFMDAWFAMEDLVAKGLVKSIGLSNFNSEQVTRVYEKSTVKPVVNQVECHPYMSQERLAQHCGTYSIRMSCYGCLGSKGTPAHLKSTAVSPVIDDSLVRVMASGLHITPAQLLIRYQLERGHSVVVKSSTAAHLWDNLKTFNIKLTDREIDALSALNKNKRTFTFKGMGDTHKNYPFKIQF